MSLNNVLIIIYLAYNAYMIIIKPNNISSTSSRFGFGANWSRFLHYLNDDRIFEAEKSLINMLQKSDLRNLKFLDIGSGSGLFSLAARRLGASVHSFDYDHRSVACTQELKNRFFINDAQWHVENGSALDADYLKSLGQFDIVYSWGVLHHTGNMWQALENVANCVRSDGLLFLSIYNDQGRWSKIWKLIKKVYNKLPSILKLPYVVLIVIPREGKTILTSSVSLHPIKNLRFYIDSWINYKKNRGMSRWHDLVDWVGGYPFEVAKPEEIFEFYRNKGFELIKLKTCGAGLGCNEYIFKKKAE